MKSVVPYINFLVLVLILVVCTLNYCGKLHDNLLSDRDTLSNNITLTYDSGQKIILQPKIYNTYNLPSMVPTGLDTAGLAPMIREIIERHFEKRVHVDTRRDSFLEATIQDTISQNTILGRSFTYKLLRPQLIQNTAVLSDKRRNKLLIGGAMGIPNDKLSFDLSAGMLLKNENMIGLDYSLTEEGTTFEKFRLRYLVKISLRPP